MVRIALVAILSLLAGTAAAQRVGGAQSDPFALKENIRCDAGAYRCNQGFADVNSKTIRSSVLDTGVRNLILIIGGQSNACAVATTSYTPTNASVIDNFNIYDGANYNAAGVLLGSCWLNTQLGGNALGHIGGRIADKFITNGIFDRVIIVPYAIGGTGITDWGIVGGVRGPLYGNHAVVIKRLAARGIVPGTNVTFAHLWMQGESDGATSQANYQAGYGTVVAALNAAGFSGRFFVAQQTRVTGTNNSTVRAAQAAVVDNATIFSAGDIDAITTGRYADGAHLDDAAIATAATTIYNAMRASGSPY